MQNKPQGFKPEVSYAINLILKEVSNFMKKRN